MKRINFLIKLHKEATDGGSTKPLGYNIPCDVDYIFLCL